MKLSESMIKKLCSSMIYKRGVEYFRDGRVHMRRRTEDELTAVVDGDELYNVRVAFGESGIEEALCSCPYYETMQTTCKHIVAVLLQRRSELEHGALYTGENDRIAAAMCADYVKRGERRRIRAAFTLYKDAQDGGAPVYEVAVALPEYGVTVESREQFLESYINYTDYRIDRSAVYNRNDMYFPENEDRIIKILAEIYQTRRLGSGTAFGDSRRTVFGAETAKRILPLLANTDFKLVAGGLVLTGVRIMCEDPDIPIDVEAFEREISVSIADTGTAITPDGEWFLYNDILYRTSREWREYFMPVHKALVTGRRNEIIFTGENTMLFAANVLPVLRNRRNVVINGVDNIIINQRPEFEICLDADSGAVTAVIVAVYGAVKFRIPTEISPTDEKIIIRDSDAENRVLSFFNRFDREKSVFTLHGDAAVYSFLTESVPRLSELASIVMTEQFREITVQDDLDLSLSVSYKRDIDFLEIEFDTDLTAEEIRGILSAKRSGHDFYRSSGGGYISVKNNKKADILSLLERLDLTKADIDHGSKKLPKFHLLYLEANSDVHKDRSVREYLEEIRARKPQIPKGLVTVLRPYQRDGLKWLGELSEMGLGGILADDMGLGKTLQVMAYIHGIRPQKPVLVVAPSALIYNWQSELEKFIPDADSLIISGPKEVRGELIKEIYKHEFVITSYPLLRRDISGYRHTEFSYCFIDEAQYIKNPKTMNAVSVKRIRAEHKFALTGTPVENSLTELWSIFDFVMPGYLKSLTEFRERFELPILRDGGAEPSGALRGIIRPFVLRRMKSDVLAELPAKIETVMYAELTREQKALYIELIRSIKDRRAEILSDRMELLTLLLRLRQICCHPALYSGADDARPEESGKLELLSELIKSGTASGHRLLIFSQFRSMLDIISDMVMRAGLDYFYINGSTPATERVRMAEEFNNGRRSVFLVSLKAGGTGLNLIGADMVIHYDPWWNPAVTDQATDRAYRIGQTNPVQVIKLAARGTIEDKIIRLQDRKKRLADDIIRVNSETLSGLSDDEIMSLFEF